MRVEIVFDRGGQFEGPLFIDVVTEEQHSLSSQVTDHPVEIGVNIVDHMKPEPRQLMIHGVIAAAPLKAQAGDESPTRTRDQWEILTRARDKALLAIVTTEIETYDSMVLSDVRAPRTSQDSEWLKVDLTFKQIRKVATETAIEPPRPRDRRQVNRGTQAVREAPSQMRSLLSRLDEATGLNIARVLH